MKDEYLININNLPIKVKHSKLERLNNESYYKSKCLSCLRGILLVCRDQKTLELQAKDRCIVCGQLFIYEDIIRLQNREHGADGYM